MDHHSQRLIFIFFNVHVCVVYVCTCVPVCVHAYTGGWRLISGTSLVIFMEARSLIRPKLAHKADHGCQLTLEILSLPSEAMVTDPPSTYNAFED